jgi:hypothetical protein
MMAGKYRAYPDYKDSGVEWLGFVPVHWQRGLKSNGTKTYAKEHTCPPMLGSVA